MEWRAVSGADVDALAELLGRDEEATVGRRESVPAEARSMLVAPGLDLPSRTWTASGPDGGLLGFAALHPAPQPGELRAQLVVAPSPDAPAVTATLLDRLDVWGAHDLPTPDTPVTLLPGCFPQNQLLSRSWTVVDTSSRLTVDLDAIRLPEHPAPPEPGKTAGWSGGPEVVAKILGRLPQPTCLGRPFPGRGQHVGTRMGKMNTALGAIMAAKGLLRGCGGLWGYLASRVHGRTVVELERERNAATAAVIPLLPPGAELLETEPGGRTRMIRMAPVDQLPVIVRVDRRPAGELPQ